MASRIRAFTTGQPVQGSASRRRGHAGTDVFADRRRRPAAHHPARARGARTRSPRAGGGAATRGRRAAAQLHATSATRAAPAATVTDFDVPFSKLVMFFIKAVFAAIPALLILMAMLWLFGQGLQSAFPQLLQDEDRRADLCAPVGSRLPPPAEEPLGRRVARSARSRPRAPAHAALCCSSRYSRSGSSRPGMASDGASPTGGAPSRRVERRPRWDRTGSSAACRRARRTTRTPPRTAPGRSRRATRSAPRTGATGRITGRRERAAARDPYREVGGIDGHQHASRGDGRRRHLQRGCRKPHEVGVVAPVRLRPAAQL